METPIEHFWSIRLKDVKSALEKNNFEVFLAENGSEATDIAMGKLFPKINPKSVSWGGSMTFIASGLYDSIRGVEGIEILDVFDKTTPPEEKLEQRRRALLADLFITGTNAVTETGKLVNLDMYGNRVAAITFGPKHVIILVGRNKIVPGIDEAMIRIKNYVAPTNAMRLNKNTPCVKTSHCEECAGPDRICNSWTITEKSFPKGRIKVILINQNLGI